MNKTDADSERQRTLDGCQRGLGGRGDEIKKYRLVLRKQSQGCKYSTGNIVNNIVITTYGARWVLEISGEHL